MIPVAILTSDDSVKLSCAPRLLESTRFALQTVGMGRGASKPDSRVKNSRSKDRRVAKLGDIPIYGGMISPL